MFKIIVPAVAALGLVAFAAKTQAVTASSEPLVAPSIAAPAQPMAWHLSKEGSAAKLAYGVAHSDQLAMMVMCEPGQATAAVYGDVKPASARVDKASADEGMDPSMQESVVSLHDAALTDLADKGAMTVVGDGGRFAIRASKNEQRAIRQFLDYCGRNRT